MFLCFTCTMQDAHTADNFAAISGVVTRSSTNRQNFFHVAQIRHPSLDAAAIRAEASEHDGICRVSVNDHFCGLAMILASQAVPRETQ